MAQAKVARMPPQSMTDRTHAHAHHTTLSTQHEASTAMPVARQRCLLGVPLSSQAEDSRAPPFGFR